MIFILLLLLLSPISALGQSLTMHETWPALPPNADEGWHNNGGCYSYSKAVVTDPCGGTNKVLRVRVIIGDDNSACEPPWDDLAGSNCAGPAPHYSYKHRNEIMEDRNGGGDTRPDIGQNFWLGWRIFVPTNWPSPNRMSPIVSQMVDVDGGADGTDWALWIKDESWFDEQRNTPENGSSPNGHINTTVAPLVRGTWNNFVLHERRHSSSGEHRLWYNGDLKVDISPQRTTSSNQPNSWWKFGLYRGCLSKSYAGQTYDLYFDDLKVAYGTDSQNLKSLVEPKTAPGKCGSSPPPDPDPEPDPDLPPIGDPITEESCTVSQQPGTNGLIIVPDSQPNLETVVETNTSKTILVKEGNYVVDNFQIGAGNVVKPYDCQSAQVVVNGTSDNLITADNWTIAGMRFFCGGLDRDCFQLDDANGWTMRNNEIKEIMRGGPHITGNSGSGTLDGNTFESCPTCVQGNMVTVGDITDPGGVGCTGTPCLFGNSPLNITIKNNTFTGSISPGNTGSGGNHMLAIDGYSRLGLEIYDNVFRNPHNFWSAISFTNNWLRAGNALNGSAHVHHNTIYGPFTGKGASSGPNGPAIYLQDAVGCKASNDCPNHRIHHNYIRDAYTADISTDGRKLSGGFKGHSSRYSTATIEHNVDDNANNVDDRETEAVHGMIFRQNTFFNSAFRFQNEICTDTHTADNLVFDKNAFYATEIVDSCAGSPDWLISNNVIGSAPSTFVAGHLDSGNTTTVISFGNVTQNSEDFTITTASESQKGALPVPTIASAVIGDDCSLNITMAPFNANGHNHGPISLVDKSRITVKYDGVAQTISSANIATNVVKLQMAECPTGGDTVTLDTGYGWCQDSANVGGVEKHMNARCLAATGSAVTNNVTGGAPPAPSTFYIDASCVTNGNGTTQTCGATGPWNSFKAALETAACAGMVPGSTLEVKGDGSLDLTCEGGSTNCYFEDDVQVAAGCSGITIQNATNEHVVVDGTMDIHGSTWTSIGSGVYRCATSGCSGGIGDVFAYRAWYDRGAGAESLDLIQSNQICDTTLAAGTMRVNQTDQSICVKLSNSSSPASASYFRVPWNSPFINGVVGNASNITLRENPSGTGTFHVQRYRNNAIEIDAPSNPGWRIEGLQIHDIMNRCLMLAGPDGDAAWKILNNTISFCGQEGIRLLGDTGSFEISGNTITDIQPLSDYELCSGVGTGCLSGIPDDAKGIRLTNNNGVGGVVEENTILRIGGGIRGDARAINLENNNSNITIRNNYIAHMSNLPLLGAGILFAGSLSGGLTNDGMKVYNNRLYDMDICYHWNYTAIYGSQSGTTNYLLNNTCAEPVYTGLLAEWANSALLDGTVFVQNNIFSAINTSPGSLIQLSANNITGWQNLENNVFECDGCEPFEPCEDCDLKTRIVLWGGQMFAADTDCDPGTDCIEDMASILGGSQFANNDYGDINVNTSGGTEPDLQIEDPSIAIDSGRSVPYVATDYLGTPRPRGSAYDAGAYESAGATTFTLTQKSFRFYAGRAEDGASPMAAENTNIGVFGSSVFSLRFAVVASEGDAPPIDLAVWARKCNPSCGSWTLVNASSDATVGVYIVNNPARANGELISNGLTLGSNVFDPASKAIDGLPNAIGSAIVNNRQFEAEYHLGVSSGISQGDTVEMRVEQSGGADLDAYTVTPVMTVGKPTANLHGVIWR